MSTYRRNIDSKKEEFRKYLENSGVPDALIRILTMILENGKQEISDPLQFVKEKLEMSNPNLVEFQHLREYLDAARERISHLESEVSQLQEELATYKEK